MDWADDEEYYFEVDDGTRLQAGLCHPILDEPTSEGVISGSLYGVVVDKFYPDEKSNRFGETVEYTVLLVGNRGLISGVRSTASQNSYKGGRHGVHRVATKTISGNKLDYETTPIEDFDGDIVQIDFIDGFAMDPIITDVMPHPNAVYKPSSKEGDVERLEHADTVVLVDKDGQVSVTRAKEDEEQTSVKILDNKTVELSVAGTSIRLTENNLAVTTTNAEFEVTQMRVHGGGASSPVCKQELLTQLQALSTQLVSMSNIVYTYFNTATGTPADVAGALAVAKLAMLPVVAQLSGINNLIQAGNATMLTTKLESE